MQLSRNHIFNGLSSCSIPSFFILLLFAGSLSTVHTTVSDDEPPTENGTLVSFDIPETNAHSSTTIENYLESFDLRNSKANLAEATVDSDDTSLQSNATEITTNVSDTSTESSASASTTTYSVMPISTAITSPAASVGTSSIASLTTEPNLPTTLTFPISTIITTSPTITTETEAEIITMSTTVSESDPPESFTAETSTEKSGGMPTGIVALVTMITFAIIAVVAYVGLIVWRRYLEYRYGNRELLVNDLEFDTNDLRHFEL